MLPIVVLLIIAVVDLGVGVYAYNTIANAARQGARVAAVNQLEFSSGACRQDRPVQDPGDASWSIKDCAAYYAVSLGIPASSVDVSYWQVDRDTSGGRVPCSIIRVGCVASVNVEYSYAPFTPIVSTIVSSIFMSAASEMPIERVFP